jgi:hypothetical protein
MRPIYPSAVFPTPDGPKTSVTFPRMYPPDTSWPGRLGGSRTLLSCVMPVETVRAPRAWSFWRAWDADTVGSLSAIALASQGRCDGCNYLRDEDGSAASSLAMVTLDAIEQASAAFLEHVIVS